MSTESKQQQQQQSRGTVIRSIDNNDNTDRSLNTADTVNTDTDRSLGELEYEEVPVIDSDNESTASIDDIQRTLSEIKLKQQQSDNDLTFSNELGNHSRNRSSRHSTARTTSTSGGDSNTAAITTPGATGTAASINYRNVEEFLRTIFHQLSLHRTLQQFQIEYYELLSNQPELINNNAVLKEINELYEQRELHNSELRLLLDRVSIAESTSTAAKSQFNKFRSERDFHRLHHRRVITEKNLLIRDLKRLQSHCETFEPALAAMKAKYEKAAKETMLIKLDRDRVQKKLDAAELKLKQLAKHQPNQAISNNNNNNSTAAESINAASTVFNQPFTATTNNNSNIISPKQVRTATGTGTGNGRRSIGNNTGSNYNSTLSNTIERRRRNESTFPEPNRLNPYNNSRYNPVNVSSFELKSTINTAHTAAISALAYHSTKSLLVSGSDDCSWKLWNCSNNSESAAASAAPELLMTGDGHKQWISAVQFGPINTIASNTLLTASGDSTLKLWNLSDCICTTTIIDHTAALWDCNWHDSGDFIASASMDHTAKLFDSNTARCRQSFRGHVDSVNSVSFQPYSNILLTASGDKTISLWDMRSGLCTQTLYGHSNAVLYSRFNYQGTQLISSDADGIIKLWDIRTVSEILSIGSNTAAGAGAGHPLNECSYDLSGELIVSGSDDGIVRIYKSLNGELLSELSGHSDSVQSVIWDNQSQSIISAGSDQTIRIWGN